MLSDALPQPPASLTTRLKTCLCCGEPAYGFVSRLDLGELAVPDFPKYPDITIPRARLHLVECPTCHLVQLSEHTDPAVLYSQYWYRSGTNETMRAELESIAYGLRHYIEPHWQPNRWVLDLGANDGTLLSALHTRPGNRPYLLGAVEPSPTFAPALMQIADVVVQDFFPCPALTPLRHKIDGIASIAMFYAVRNPRAFVYAIDHLLSRHGVWVVQMQDLVQQLQQGAFDNVCHEHVAAYSLATFERLLVGTDLRVFHVERRAVNGGSLRFWIDRGHRPQTLAYWSWSSFEESWWGEDPNQRWGYFRIRMSQSIAAIREILLQAQFYGQKVHQYGASTKAAIFCQLADLDGRLLEWCWERAAEKRGRHTVTGVPIFSEEMGRELQPDFLLSTIWQFKHSTIDREADYLDRGGRILFALPRLHWVTREGEKPC